MDYGLTVSCYQADPNGRACGLCDALPAAPRRLFEEAGIDDPRPTSNPKPGDYDRGAPVPRSLHPGTQTAQRAQSMDETLIASSTIAWLAFALGVVFGFVGNKTNFCTLGAISDAMNIGDWGRMRMWALAMAVAIFGASALQFAGLIDVHKVDLHRLGLLWLSHVVGGLLFGAGMTLASGCGSKTLIRIGTGNLKSLVVFAFLGIAAYMTLRGLFGTWRVAALDSVAIDLAGTQDLPAILARQAGMAADTAMMAAATVVGGALSRCSHSRAATHGGAMSCSVAR